MFFRRLIRRLSLATVLVSGLFTHPLPTRADSPQRPNIVFILVDDMGWTDVGGFGSRFYETPNIDSLAAQGMKFTQAYAACTVCSPSRAALLTGQYPARLHITDWIPGYTRPHGKLVAPDWLQHLPTEVPNIARALKAGGYATASIGKWHLGGPPFYPDKQGFELNLGGTDKGMPPSYFSPYGIPTLPDGPKGEFLSDRLTVEAIKFIERNRTRPFFLYLPHFAVHTPIQGKPEVIAKYKAKMRPSAPQHDPAYAALVESVDDSVGAILKKLGELRLTERTIVIFTSDNGGLIKPTSNLPLRAGKGSAYEGGVRVPLIIRWPGVTVAGSQSATPVIGTDFYPTLLEMTGVDDPANHQFDDQNLASPIDGESLVPLLNRSGSLNRTAIFWHYPHYHVGGATPYSAIREGKFKLIEFYEDHHRELYNLDDDIGETRNLASKMSALADRLQAKLNDWRAAVGAQAPSPNPNYIPGKAATEFGRPSPRLRDE
jgi:arylsulfatase A